MMFTDIIKLGFTEVLNVGRVSTGALACFGYGFTCQHN
jgi:hypothetical protein